MRTVWVRMKTFVTDGFIGAALMVVYAGCGECACQKAPQGPETVPVAVASEPSPRAGDEAEVAYGPEADEADGQLDDGDDEEELGEGEADSDEFVAPGSNGTPALSAGAIASTAPPASATARSGLGSAVRDGRRVRQTPRTQALLQAEIRGLERLFAATPRRAADRPRVLRRLADNYAELAAAVTGDPQREPAARAGAIRHYQQLQREYPNDPNLDEVLYYLALAFERHGDANNARRTYFELIQKVPKSTFIPLAYLGFAEMFFMESTGDPTKWPLAEQAYREVVKYPAPQNQAECYARLQLGHALQRAGKPAAAATEFRGALRCANAHAQLPESAAVAQAARRAGARP